MLREKETWRQSEAQERKTYEEKKEGKAEVHLFSAVYEIGLLFCVRLSGDL